MKGGVLEVLLVSAEGLSHRTYFGYTGYYAVIRCGKVTCKSKITSGKGKKVLWNQKFIFKFSLQDWQNLQHLSIRIMDRRMFRRDDILGESIIHLGGLLEEGSINGWLEIKPSPYVLVAENGTYDGAIKVGIKYINNVDMNAINRKDMGRAEKPPGSLYKSIYKFIRIPWYTFYFHLRSKKISKQKLAQDQVKPKRSAPANSTRN